MTVTIDAANIMSLATAVLIGNIATIMLIKGYQRMKREDRFEWVTAGLYLAPLMLIVGILATTR